MACCLQTEEGESVVSKYTWQFNWLNCSHPSGRLLFFCRRDPHERKQMLQSSEAQLDLDLSPRMDSQKEVLLNALELISE